MSYDLQEVTQECNKIILEEMFNYLFERNIPEQEIVNVLLTSLSYVYAMMSIHLPDGAYAQELGKILELVEVNSLDFRLGFKERMEGEDARA